MALCVRKHDSADNIIKKDVSLIKQEDSLNPDSLKTKYVAYRAASKVGATRSISSNSTFKDRQLYKSF